MVTSVSLSPPSLASRRLGLVWEAASYPIHHLTLQSTAPTPSSPAHAASQESADSTAALSAPSPQADRDRLLSHISPSPASALPQPSSSPAPVSKSAVTECAPPPGYPPLAETPSEPSAGS